MFTSDDNMTYQQRLDRAEQRVERLKGCLRDAEWDLEIIKKEPSVRRMMEDDSYQRQR